MHRLVAALVVIAACVLAGQAQEGQPKGKLLSVAKDGNESVWTLSGSGELSFREILEAYAEASEQKILFHPKDLSGEISVHSPRSGIKLTGQQIDMFVASAFAEIHHGIVERDDGMLEIVRGTEAIAEGSSILTPEELATANPSRLVTCIVQLNGLEPNSVCGVFRNLASRTFGTVNPVHGMNAVVIGERGSRAKELVAAIQKLDDSMKREAKFYPLPVATDLKKASDTINALFNEPRRPHQAGIAAAPDEGRHGLLVMAPARFHSEIEVAISALK